MNKFLLLTSLCVSLMFFSQDNATGVNGNAAVEPTGKIPAIEAIRHLQEKHETLIFYRTRWLEDQYVDDNILIMPLERALLVIGETAGLSHVFMEDHIVFLPGPGTAGQKPSDEDDDVLIVGTAEEYGRHTRATLSGRVVCGTSGEALIGAVIYDPVSEAGASTNVEGRFEIGLPTGDHRLRVSYVGYQTGHQEIRLYSDGNADFQLFESTVQLDEVTVTARSARENIERTQMSVITMDSQTIEGLQGTFGERDIVRSITLLPGVQSVGEFGTGFNVRGGDADQNLILIENVPLFNTSHLLGLISVVNADVISDVTLIKAGIPPRYGERASSVMDIRLKNSLDTEGTSIHGGIGLLNSRLLLETPIVEDRASIYIGGRTSYSDFLLDYTNDEDLVNSTARFHDVTGTLNIALSPNNRLTLFGYQSFDRFGFGKETTHEYTNLLASARLNTSFSSRLSSSLVAGFSDYRYGIYEESEVRSHLDYRMNSGINYQTAKYVMSFIPDNHHRFEAGIQAVRYEIEPGKLRPFGEDSRVTPNLMEREQGLELSGFIGDEFRWSDNISVEAGVRYTHYFQRGPGRVYQYLENAPRRIENITDTINYASGDVIADYGGLEPRLGFRFSNRENSSWKLSYNRNNQYINLISNTSIMAPADIWKLSDTHISPLKSDQFALGYFHNFLGNTLETSLEVYYKKLGDIIEYRSGAQVVMNELLETDILQAKGYSYGAELYVRKQSGFLTGWASYTYSSSMRRTTQSEPENQINGNAYFPSNYDRPHNLNINASYQLTRRLRLAATFSYSTGRPITLPEHIFWHGSDVMIRFSDRNKYRLPDFHRLDVTLHIGKRLRRDNRGGSWSISVMNLYGRKNPYSVFYKRTHGRLDPVDSFNLYQLYILGRPLPTITYNFTI